MTTTGSRLSGGSFLQKPVLTTEQKIRLLEQRISNERSVLMLLTIASILGITAPILAPQYLPKWARVAAIGGSALVASGVAYAAGKGVKKEEIFNGYEKRSTQSFLTREAQQMTNEDMDDEIRNNAARAARIMKQYPQPMWIPLLAKYGLQEWIPIAQQIQREMNPPPPAPVVAPAVVVGQKAIDAAIAEGREPMDYSWIDSKFIRQSKVICAPKGSGKSVLASYLSARFVAENPDGELRICDPHFSLRSAEYAEDETIWLPGIPKNVVSEQYLVKDADSAFKMFLRLRQEGRRRVDNELKNEPELHLLCDEFDGYVKRWSDNQLEEIVGPKGIIQEVQDEYRKYHVNCSLIVHSLKKENTGVDSSAFAQMDMLFLGSSLADPNTKYPADIEPKRLLAAQQMMQQQLEKQDGFACVVRKLNEPAQIQVVPWINPMDHALQYGGGVAQKPAEVKEIPEDLSWEEKLERLKQWVIQQGTVSDETLKQKYEDLTGLKLNTPDAVAYLREMLGI